MHRLLLLPTLAALLLGTPSSAQQEVKTLRKTISTTVELDYLIHLPEGYSESGPPMPLVLFLHGAGERGSDINVVKKHGPPMLLEAGESIPAIVVSPQCPAGEWWNDHVTGLGALLDEIESSYNVDSDRIYVTGLSMGGFGTWALAAAEPERFAALMPICGGGMALMARLLTDVPIWVFHGDADVVVSVEESRRMVAALERFGSKSVKFTSYSGVNHDSWTQTYDNPEVWEWLFSQKRE